MAAGRKWAIALAVIFTFVMFTLAIVFLAANAFVTPQLALLLFIALFGLYVGFGILIAVYRLIAKLE